MSRKNHADQIAVNASEAKRHKVPVRLGLLTAAGGLALILTGCAESSNNASEVFKGQLDGVTVEDGGSLYGTARRIQTNTGYLGEDVRPWIAELKKVNNLESSTLEARQQLLVPIAADADPNVAGVQLTVPK